MRRPQRRLSADEAALWARVAQTITPLVKPASPARDAQDDRAETAVAGPPPPPGKFSKRAKPTVPLPQPVAGPAPRPKEERQRLDRHGLDASWDRKLAQGGVAPDFTLDLHGHTLDAAHARLDHGLALALAQNARLVLLITGRERPSEDRRSRGAIRRKFLDWLAHGSHASRIAAIRPAHPRHGGAGAVYIVLKRLR